MIAVRRASDRGESQRGWLDSRHTFSFAEYYDPRHMGFRALRVINEDRVIPGKGFPTHAHRDMEIVTYVVEGAIEHKDSMGNGSVIRPGDVQRMSAGTGVTHSEYNPSPAEPVHFLQIWILPERDGLPPGYEQRQFSPKEKQGALRLVASSTGRDGSVTVHQDVEVYAALLAPGDELTHLLAHGRHAWVQVVSGAVGIGSTPLTEGDGAALSDERVVTLRAEEPSELLLFDLA
jgi:quercetin 2,3-dioxygenase